MTRRRSIGFIQLPVPDTESANARANVPLAAAYLKATCVGAGLVSAGQVRILPRELANHGGDRAILDWVRSGQLSLLGFTVYLWNLERSLWLARRSREENPGLKIVFGGPEVAGGQPLLDSPFVDHFILGEGEQAFVSLLRRLGSGRPLPRSLSSDRRADLAGIPNPYLSGALPARPEEPLYLETMRGCPYRCAYCFYGKSFPEVRPFPPQRLAGVFSLARAAGVPEIYFMDPSFNAAPGLADRLESIAALNSSRIPLHTEIRLESVTEGIARLLAKAGFASVEVGLQSTNQRALAAIGRSWQRERFLRGAQLLRQQGILIRTGIILGLPHDTLQSLESTLDFIVEQDLVENLDVFPLALLPGTELRQRAGDLGLEFMGFPPYYLLSGPWMKEEELFLALRLVEEKLDGELFAPILPRFGDPRPELKGFLDLRGAGQARRLMDKPERIASYLTLLVSERQLAEPAELAELGAWLEEHNPHTLTQIVIDCPRPPDRRAAERLAGLFFNPRHYFNRLNYYREDLQGRFSTRLYHLLSDPETARRYYREPLPCDPILRYSPVLAERCPDLLEERPLLLVEGVLSQPERRRLAEQYRGAENLILFAGRDA